MKKFFSKRIKLFGRSISLALLIGILVVSAAAAGWFFRDYAMNVTATSGEAPSITVSEVTCNGLNYVLTDCTYDAGTETFTVGYTDIYPDSMMAINFNAHVEAGDGPLHINFEPGVIPDWVLNIDVFACGDATLADNSNTSCMIQVWPDVDNLHPETILEPLTLNYHLEKLP